MKKLEAHDDTGGDVKERDEIIVRSSTNESHLLDIIPFHVLQMIMEFCVGVDYLNFRATCKLCRLAAPVTIFETAYPLVSPRLMVFEEHQGTLFTFTDPIFGDKYFKRIPSKLCFNNRRILCSRYGWLLLFTNHFHIVFFNPFTRNIIELPQVPQLESFCFSAPPTSPECMVFGLSRSCSWNVYIHFVGREPSWRKFRLDFSDILISSHFSFSTFCGKDVYAMRNQGVLQVFRGIHEGNISWETVVDEAPRSRYRYCVEYFVVECDGCLMLVVVGELGGSVEVFKLKDCKWEKMDCIGRHVIYVCGATCICMDAKTPELENKIFFPRLHLKNGKIVFYSLETGKYHTLNGGNMEENISYFFVSEEHMDTHVWIEPNWS